MTDLPHIASRLFGTPLLVARAKLDVILGVLGPRLASHDLEPSGFDTMPSRESERTPEGIAIVPVTGTLVSRSGYLGAASGLMSYGDIGDAIENAALDPLVWGIVLDIDSPGGEVGGLFDLTDRIAAIRRDTGKPIHAVANEAALSAAYAIASAADEITITQTGEVGSIGVVAVHVDESAADRQAGLAWSFIHAGECKVDGNPHEPLSPRARADIQADVDLLYERFVALVARHRDLSPEAVRATEAGICRGDLAVRAGLADRVGTLRQTIDQMATRFFRNPISRSGVISPNRHSSSVDAQSVSVAAHCSPPAKEAYMQNDPNNRPTPEDEDTPSLHEKDEDVPIIPQPIPNEPEPALGIEQRLRSEYAELSAVAGQAQRLGVKIDVAEAMAKGTSPDAIRRSVLEQLAARSDATDLVAAAPALGAAPACESPIVKRARAAASRS
jgi:capsid assembly protease